MGRSRARFERTAGDPRSAPAEAAGPPRLIALLFLVACGRDDARLAAIEARLTAIEAQNALAVQTPRPSVEIPPGGAIPPSAEALRGLEVRLQALESAEGTTAPIVASVSTGSPAPTDSAHLMVDPATGRVSPRPTEALAVECAYGALGGVTRAELAYDAAFDGFDADFAKIGWELDGASGCDRMVAVKVTVGDNSFDAVAVVTAGPTRGRWFHCGPDARVIDGGTMSERQIVAIEADAKRR